MIRHSIKAFQHAEHLHITLRGVVFAQTIGYSLLIITGCTHTMTMIPHPIIYHDPRFEGLTSIPPDQQTLTTDIFYATTRGGDGPPDHRTYTNDVGDAIRLGVASVRFGDATTSWDDLAAEVRTEQHTSRLAVQVGQARELGTLPTAPDAPDVLSDQERPFIEDNDILTLFKFQLPPDRRGLLRLSGQGQNYFFPEDYPKRAFHALEAALKEYDGTGAEDTWQP